MRCLEHLILLDASLWRHSSTSPTGRRPCGSPRTHWRDYISGNTSGSPRRSRRCGGLSCLTYQATVTVFFCLCPSLFLSISILCKHMDVLVSHPISRAHRQMLPLHLTFFSPILPGLECLLSASVYRVLLRLGRADVRLRPGASVLKSSKCFHVNSEFQHYPQSQLAGQWLRKGCTAKGRGPELKPDVSCDLSSHCVVANSPQP